ncbi:MAG: hypothetical protein E7266_09640 [Lachnospiraceae bacterium]|nr:hypothetical protein [Lachnospiraceae bacterium]
MKQKKMNIKEMMTILRNYEQMSEDDKKFLENCTGRNRYDLKKVLQQNCYYLGNLTIAYKKQLRKDIDLMTSYEKQVVAEINNMTIDEVVASLDESIAEQKKGNEDLRAFNKEWAKCEPEFERKFREENGGFDNPSGNFLKLMKYNEEKLDAMIALAKEMGIHITVGSVMGTRHC